jgi:hypothetical protein
MMLGVDCAAIVDTLVVMVAVLLLTLRVIEGLSMSVCETIKYGSVSIDDSEIQVLSA